MSKLYRVLIGIYIAVPDSAIKTWGVWVNNLSYWVSNFTKFNSQIISRFYCLFRVIYLFLVIRLLTTSVNYEESMYTTQSTRDNQLLHPSPGAISRILSIILSQGSIAFSLNISLHRTLTPCKKLTININQLESDYCSIHSWQFSHYTPDSGIAQKIYSSLLLLHRCLYCTISSHKVHYVNNTIYHANCMILPCYSHGNAIKKT